MPLPSDPVGRALVQMIARDRYERWLQSEIETLLADGLREVAGLLTGPYSAMSPTALQRRAVLFKQVTRLLGQTYGKSADFMLAQMKSYAGIEAQATIGYFRSLVADSANADVTLQNLTRAEVKAIAEFPIAGLGISDWFEKQASDMNATIRGQIQLGLVNGETPQQIAGKRIWPQLPTPDDPGVFPRTRRSTIALVRTTTTTIQTQASYETLRSIGDEYVPAYRYVAVRDGRTTPICRALDGRVFRFDDPKAKRPPQHINCRSTIVAEPNYERLGIPAPNTVKGGFTRGSYADWLQQQPPAFQDDLLGRSGGSQFRAGTPLDQIVATDTRRMTDKALATEYSAPARNERPVEVTPPAPPPAPAISDVAEQKALERFQAEPYLTADELDALGDDPEQAGKVKAAPFKGDGFHLEAKVEENGGNWQLYRASTENASAAPVRTVQIADLYRTQGTITPSIVEKYIADPTAGTVSGSGEASDLPMVVRYLGKNWILDGHHRLAAMELLGLDTAKVHFIDFDAAMKVYGRGASFDKAVAAAFGRAR